jgi:hypothetical protein
MSNLPPNTVRRLNKLPQIPSVWEGDRRPLGGIADEIDPEAFDGNGDCIIWVDGSEGVVRSMEVVSPAMGMEAVVRALIKAIENPHNPALPSRPQKVIVRDRELHFFLRGTLPHLNIDIDYAPELPIIDELFRGFEQVSNTRPPKLPPKYAQRLVKIAYDLWQEAPWQSLADHHIIAIKLNRWDVETLYISIMGLLGKEYGILMYRSLDSLERFRSTVLNERSVENLEKAFLSQNCWFVNYETDDEDFDPGEDDLADWPDDEIFPLFGSLHPLEGMRPFLDEEEALAVCIALEALLCFVRDKRSQLAKAEQNFRRLKKQYRLSLPIESELSEILSVEVSTRPDLADEFMEMIEQAAPHPFESLFDELDDAPLIREDLIPEDAIILLKSLSPDDLQSLGDNPKTAYTVTPFSTPELPTIWIQTSRPKAKAMIEQLKASGGIKAVCFNPGEDPFTDTFFDLGLLQTADDSLYLFEEFHKDNRAYLAQRRDWDRRCAASEGRCSVAIAMGVTGTARGQFRLSDILAVFETRLMAAEELGMGTLQLVPQVSGFELEF